MDKQIIRTYIDKYQNKGVFHLNLADPNDRKFYESQITTAGISAEIFAAFANAILVAQATLKQVNPMLFAQLDSIYPVHGIAALESVDGLKYSTTALTSIPKTATNITQTLGIFDEATNLLGKIAYNKHYNTGANCQIEADGNYKGAAQNPNKAISVIYTFSQTINGITVFAAEIVTTASYPRQIFPISPVDVNKNGLIKICLTRNSNDCDYRHTYTGVVTVPVEGYIVYYGDIDLDANKKPLNGQCTIYVVREKQGGSPLSPQESFNFFNAPNTTAIGDKLSWNLDWLTLKKADFTSGERVYYVFSVTVQVGGKPIVTYITNAPTSIVPSQPPLNTRKIKPMEIVYGCLGENTMITMKDGSVKPIQTIEMGEWVRSQDGRNLRVEDLTTGTETKYLEITYVIGKNDSEQTIVSSIGHPFVTKEGVLLAKELKKSTVLLGLNTLAKVTDIVEKEGEIGVYNLHLSTDKPIMELTEDNTTMYANGVLVGDSVMQRTFEKKFEQKEENVLDQLPDEWKQDYLNFLKHKS